MLLQKSDAYKFILAYYYRRLLMAVVVLSLYDYNALQVVFTLLLNLFFTALLLHYRPFESQLETRLECLNENICLLIIYSMFCFTSGSLPDGREREYVGYGMIGATCICFAVSMVLLLRAVKHLIWRLVIKCKRKAASKRLRRYLLERTEEETAYAHKVEERYLIALRNMRKCD